MVVGETFTAIDIGSSKIKTLIGVFNEEKKLQVLGVGITPSLGVRKGNILDMEEFKNNVDNALLEAEKMTGEQVSHIYLTFAGTSLEIFSNRGIISVADHEINEDDVNRVLDMAKNGVDLNNRVVLKVIPETFTVDSQNGIKNPLGMSAKRLEVKAHIFTISNNVLNNIKKGIEDVGVGIIDIFPSLLTAPEAVLSKRQKELGVVCVDIGASTTGVTIYEEGTLIYSSVIPIGGEHVTSDIALWARISIDVAERVKVEYGDVMFCKEEKIKDEDIDLSKFNKHETTTLSRKYLSEIVRARYQEIFYYINQELKKIGKDGMLPEGAVLTGGASKMPGILDLAKETLRLPATIGMPESADITSGTSLSDPSFACAIGTLLISQRFGGHRSNIKVNFSMGGFVNSFKNLLKKMGIE